MDFVSGLALVLLTLVGYSSGTVLGTRRKTPAPNPHDLLVVVVLWAAALSTRAALGKWPAIAVWLVAGVAAGFVLAHMRLAQYPTATAAAPGRSLWDGWRSFARRMGNYQSRMLMSFLYFTVVLPFGLAVTFLSDPLGIRHAGNPSTWRPKHIAAKPSLEEAGRQY